MKSMDDLFLHFLQDIYYAEKQGVKALAKVGKAAENEELKQFLQEHRETSQHHVEALEQIFEQLGKRPRGKTCAAMNGLIEEVNEAINEGEKGEVLDAALIACVQAMKHYEIARLGALEAWAKRMGRDEAAELLAGLVDEDKDADEDLTDIAEQANAEADDEEDEEDEDEEDGEREDGEEDGDDDEDDEDEDDDEDEKGEGEGTAEPAQPAPPGRRKTTA